MTITISPPRTDSGPTGRRPPRTKRVILSLLAGAATLALVVSVPRAVGTTWITVGGLLAGIPLAAPAGLAVVWITGLWAHSFVLAASLPGLTERRALMLSLTGSAVANVLPLGGAAGTGLNFAMLYRWGFSPAAFAGFLTVTQLVNVLAKLGVIGTALALAPALNTTTAIPAGRTGLLVIPVLVVLGLVAWFLASAPVAACVGRGADRLVAIVRPRRSTEFATALPSLRRSILWVFRQGWRPMSVGMVAYLALQGALLWLCFRALGTPPALPVILAALAVERLLTLVVITPGGLGVVEVGSIAALVALGNDPGIAAAGMLLYRGFTYLMEIPVGGILLAGWLLRNRRAAP